MAREMMRRERGLSPLQERWDPFQLMREMLAWEPLQDVERALGRSPAGMADFTPSFDVKETDEAYEFNADLPGVNEDDVDVSLSGNRLTISGKREQEQKEEGETYYTLERSYGSFSRAFTLPEGIDADHCDATFENGVLKVKLPKRAEEQPKRIKLLGKNGEQQQQQQQQQKKRNGQREQRTESGQAQQQEQRNA